MATTDGPHNTFDLGKLPDNYSLALKTETAAELTARLKGQEEDEKHRRKKDFVTFLFSLGAILLALVVATVLVFSSEKEVRQMGISLLCLIIGGLVGYVTGKSSKG